MQLSDLNGGTPDKKPWLNIKTNTLEANDVKADTVEALQVTSDLLILTDQPNVPNAPIGSTSFFSTGFGNFSQTNSTGTTTTYSTTADLDGYLPLDGSDAMTGSLDLANFKLLNFPIAESFVDDCNVIIGSGTTTTPGPAPNIRNVALGFNNPSEGFAIVSVGESLTQTASNNCVLIGSASSVSGDNSTSIGTANSVIGAGSVVIGDNFSITGDNAFAFGRSGLNNQSNTMVLGSDGILNIRPNSFSCDLGTTTLPFQTLYLKDAAISEALKYSSGDDITVANTAVETTLTSGSSLGNLAYTATLPVGSMIKFHIAINVNSAAGDTLTLKIKSNGSDLWSMAIVYGVVVNSLAIIDITAMVQAATIQFSTLRTVTATPLVQFDNAVFNPANNNTFTITAKWGLAASSAVFKQVIVESAR